MKTKPEWYTRSLNLGCYYCITRFPKHEVVDWCDNGGTAICPSCGIDSVIGDDGNDISDNALRVLSKKFEFNEKKHWGY